MVYEEFKVYEVFVIILILLGFKVMFYVFGFEILFFVEFGFGGCFVVFNVEYDVFFGIGYVCGYNLIVLVLFVLFFGVVVVFKVFGLLGCVCFLGIFVEEGGGGKLKLIVVGVYKGVLVVLMVYLGLGYNFLFYIWGVFFVCMLVNVKFCVYFIGKELYVVIVFWDGVNVFDVVCFLYNVISMLC